LSQTSHFLQCERCEGHIYYANAVKVTDRKQPGSGTNWYCKHCAGALRIT